MTSQATSVKQQRHSTAKSACPQGPNRAHEIVLVADEGLPPVVGDPDTVGRAQVRFSVTDQGLGVPLAEQRRIFDKFYRLDPNMNRGVGGTGLGLYICRELVRRMEGRIWVDSDGLGSGSTFHIELPVAGDFTAHLGAF